METNKKVIPIKTAWNTAFQEFVDQVERGDLTHALLCYRLKNGRVGFRTYNDSDLASLIGIVELVKIELCKY